MENWGLVTYRETTLLYDPILSSTENKQSVTIVIAHELAHMVGNEISANSSPKISKLVKRKGNKQDIHPQTHLSALFSSL